MLCPRNRKNLIDGFASHQSCDAIKFHSWQSGLFVLHACVTPVRKFWRAAKIAETCDESWMKLIRGMLRDAFIGIARNGCDIDVSTNGPRNKENVFTSYQFSVFNPQRDVEFEHM